MTKNSGETPKFEITKPKGYEAQREQAVELRPGDEATTGKQQLPSGVSTLPPIPTIPAAPSMPSPGGPGATTKASNAATSDLPADDVDLIEKQWVSRAKAIVAGTQDDPYKQKKELNKAGADYLKKRFNKSIPTDDAVRT